MIDIDDIEFVCFERVQFGIKNFDMAIIFKDFTTMKRINSIPIEHIENIKEYLNDIGILYAESVANMNWTNVLQSIRQDFDAFITDGAWRFLVDDDDGQDGEEEGEDELDSDKSFSVGEEEEEDEESEYDDDSDDEDFDSSSFESESELSEEGLSWDEMERQAEEDDRKAATRRVGKEVPAPVAKRAPPPKRR